MSFLSPLFLVGMVAAAVPILLHLLRRRPEVMVKFPAVWMLRQAPVEQVSRQRLRDLLLLALRVAAIVLLSLAFARPVFNTAAIGASSGVTVVALDTSLSLNAPGRMDRAKALAREAIDGAPGEQPVAVITFSDAAVVAATPSTDRALAAAAVNAAEPGAGGTRYRAAIEAAAALVAAHGDGTGRILVVTDLQTVGWDQGDRVLLPAGIELEVIDVGPLPPNLALLHARVDGDGRVVATVGNFTQETREVAVTAVAEGTQLAEGDVTLAAGQSADAILDGVSAEGVTLQIADADGLQPDNLRFLVVSRGGPPSVLIVTETGMVEREAFYVQRAVAAEGVAGPAFAVEGAAAAALSSWQPAGLDRFAAIIITSTRGLERRGGELLAAFVERGGGVLLAAGPGVDGHVASAALGINGSIAVPSASGPRDPRGQSRTVVSIDARHPVFRTLSGGAFGSATFQRIATIGDDVCAPLARFTSGEPAFLECGRGQGKVLVFASDLDHAWNDLPRHAIFVPFLHEALRYLSLDRGEINELVVGQSAAVRSPGLITQMGADGVADVVAVNFDPRESDPGRLTPEAFSEAVSEAPAAEAAEDVEARQQEDPHDVWRYALLAMMAMLVGESVVASRPT